MTMKQKYDIERLHADCLAWCENPTWKPWMVEVGITIHFDKPIELRKGSSLFVFIPSQYYSDDIPRILEFAHFIGLDIESYRIEIDRDQAVRDYLAGIEEGAPLWEGSEWVKETIIGGAVNARCTKEPLLLIGVVTGVCNYAYTFLRLDLLEDKQ